MDLESAINVYTFIVLCRYDYTIKILTIFEKAYECSF